MICIQTLFLLSEQLFVFGSYLVFQLAAFLCNALHFVPYLTKIPSTLAVRYVQQATLTVLLLCFGYKVWYILERSGLYIIQRLNRTHVNHNITRIISSFRCEVRFM